MELKSAHSPKDTEKNPRSIREVRMNYHTLKKRILLLFGSCLSVQLINRIRKMGTKIASLQGQLAIITNKIVLITPKCLLR